MDKHPSKKQKSSHHDTSTGTGSYGPQPDPDVVVVVGDVEFQEQSFALRMWSGYFEAAFRRDELKQTGRFEFPGRDPEDWKLIKELVTPFSGAKITKENVFKILPWLDELCCKAGLELCDKFLVNEVIPDLFPEEELKTTFLGVLGKVMATDSELDQDIEDGLFEASCFNLDPFLTLTTEAMRYGLDQSAKKCFEVLDQIVSKVPFLLTPGTTLKRITTIVTILKESPECREQLWGKMKKHFLPEETQDVPDDELFANPLLPALICKGIESFLGTSALFTALATVVSLSPPPTVTVLENDDLLGPIISNLCSIDELNHDLNELQ